MCGIIIARPTGLISFPPNSMAIKAYTSSQDLSFYCMCDLKPMRVDETPPVRVYVRICAFFIYIYFLSGLAHMDA